MTELSNDSQPVSATASHRFAPMDVLVGAICVAVVALWTTRALADGNGLDQRLAWVAGQVTWRTGHPERLFSWTGTPLLGAVMAVVSRLVRSWTSVVVLSLLNGVLALGVVGVLCQRLSATVGRRWLWLIAVALVSFAPLLSTEWWKQLNVVTLTLGLAGFDLLRRDRERFGACLIGLSVAFKPLLILLPLVLLVGRGTRRAGLEAIGWVVAATMAALVFTAWRAHELSVLNPWRTIQNFSHKSTPFVPSTDNFGPVSTLARLGGVAHWHAYEAVVVVGVALLGAWCAQALRGRGARSWDAFAVAAVLSTMVSAIDWSHYQLLLAPLMVVLLLRMRMEGARPGDWVGLTVAFVLASLIWRPFGTLPGTVHTLLDRGQLVGDEWLSGAAAPMEAVSQLAQYVLIATALLWYTAHPVPEEAASPPTDHRDRAQTGVTANAR